MSGGRIAWVDYANGEHWKRKECKISINKTRVKERELGSKLTVQSRGSYCEVAEREPQAMGARRMGSIARE